MSYEQHGLGRRLQKDSRDARFPMRLKLDPMRDQFFPAGVPDGTRHYRSGPIRNQDPTGTCVAHGWLAKLNAAPIMQTLPIHMSVFDLYRRIVAVDEFDDNDHEARLPDDELQSGTTVRAGAAMLVSLGFAQSYLWAQSAEDIRSWILSGFGGVVIGIVWKSSMMTADAEHFISYTGTNQGGHCVYVGGWNDSVKRRNSTMRTVRAARIQQSWGPQWGDEGRCWISMDDLAKAIADDGEACALTEKKYLPVL